MNKLRQMHFLCLIVILMAFFSCDTSKVYEAHIDYEDAFWHQDSVGIFSFSIEDATKPYNLRANFRNSLGYPYHNMYYEYILKDEVGNILSEDLKQIFLFDEKTGEPLGNGFGDIFDHSQLILENYTFPSPGNYTAELAQAMRMDSLIFILSVGWRVETSED